MTIAQDFIKRLQDATGKEPLPQKFEGDSSCRSFGDFLKIYAEYYGALSTPQQKEEMDKIFWEQVKTIGGTPIIEDRLDSELECEVYFLLPKKNLAGSTEVPRTKKGYELALMSTLPDHNKAKAENGIIYLSEDGQYVVRDPKGVMQEGTLNTGEIDLSQLEMNLDNSDLESAVLKVTSNAGHTPKKDLYLQGDFHGYGSTDGRQRLLEFPDTGIMWHKDSMPKEALVVYQYIQVEPSHQGKKPEPELPPFFIDDEEFVPLSTNTTIFPDIPLNQCTDEYSTHTSNFPGFSPAKIIRVSADSEHAHIPGEPIDWPGLLTKETPGNTRSFLYYDTLYSDKDGNLHPHRSDVKVGERYHDDLYYSDSSESPYTNFSRDIHVFKPASGKIDDIVVVNDGRPYLMTGILDHFEKMVAEKKLSPNTALVFISPLPGLKNTLSPEAAEAFDTDPSKDLPGMGVRLIDYKHGIDEYTDFIENKLFPQLEREISAPDDPSHRIMIGSSLSGTASVYIGSKRPDLFGAVIAQSPSPDNRAILSKIPREMLTGRNIHLSCGTFEHPDYAAANANIEYASELSHKLRVPLHAGAYGHEFIAWNEELEQSLPATLTRIERVSLVAGSVAPTLTALEPLADELLQARERRQSFKVRISHATPTPAAGIAEDKTLEDDISITP